MRPPVLTFRPQPDGAQHACVGNLVIGWIWPERDGHRRWIVQATGLPLRQDNAGSLIVAQQAIGCAVVDWFALMCVLDPDDEIDIQVERATG